jgi:hypothetical protein
MRRVNGSISASRPKTGGGSGPFAPSSTHLLAMGPAVQRILSALAPAIGGFDEAERFLREAIRSGGRRTVPEDPADFRAFVEGELVPRLLPLVPLQVVRDLLEEEQGADPYPTGRVRRTTRVVLVESDPIRRTEVARGLVGIGCDVTVVDDLASAAAALPFDVAVASVAGAESEARILSQTPGAPTLITYAEHGVGETIARLAAEWPDGRVVVLPSQAAPNAVRDRVRALRRPG